MKKVSKGRIPSLLSGSNGKPKKVIVVKKSECKRCGLFILTGDICFEIPKVGGAFSSKRRYCRGCFIMILEQTSTDFDAAKVLLT